MNDREKSPEQVISSVNQLRLLIDAVADDIGPDAIFADDLRTSADTRSRLVEKAKEVIQNGKMIHPGVRSRARIKPIIHMHGAANAAQQVLRNQRSNGKKAVKPVRMVLSEFKSLSDKEMNRKLKKSKQTCSQHLEPSQ